MTTPKEVQVKLDGYFGSRAEWQKRLIPCIIGLE